MNYFSLKFFPFCRQIFTGQAPLAGGVQALVLALLYLCSPSLLALLLVELVLQLTLASFFYYLYWAYSRWTSVFVPIPPRTRDHMATDMADPSLQFWTGRGEDTAGFYVATLGEVVVGTVAYERKVGCGLRAK